jgi:hypothetical protein
MHKDPPLREGLWRFGPGKRKSWYRFEVSLAIFWLQIERLSASAARLLFFSIDGVKQHGQER